MQVNGFGLLWNLLHIKSSIRQTAFLRCGCIFLFLGDRGQQHITGRWELENSSLRRFLHRVKNICPYTSFVFNKFTQVFSRFLQRRTDRISAFRNASFSTRCGVWKQQGNHKTEWNSSQVNYGDRSAIQGLKSLAIEVALNCSRSWTSVRSSPFFPLLDGRMCRISKA